MQFDAPQPIVLCPRCRRPLTVTHVRPSYPPLPKGPLTIDCSTRPPTVVFEAFPGGAGRCGDMTGQVNYAPCAHCSQTPMPAQTPAIEWPREDVIE